MPMNINVVPTELEGVLRIEPQSFEDERGFFFESYSKARFQEHGLNLDFVQDNHSRSARNVLRGFHFQDNTQPQWRLVRSPRCFPGGPRGSSPFAVLRAGEESRDGRGTGRSSLQTELRVRVLQIPFDGSYRQHQFGRDRVVVASFRADGGCRAHAATTPTPRHRPRRSAQALGPGR